MARRRALIKHGAGKVDADDFGSAVGLQEGVSSGAAGEVDQASGASDVGGEPLGDARGDEDGVFEAVEALPGVVDIGESGVGGGGRSEGRGVRSERRRGEEGEDGARGGA